MSRFFVAGKLPLELCGVRHARGDRLPTSAVLALKPAALRQLLESRRIIEVEGDAPVAAGAAAARVDTHAPAKVR